LVYYKYIWYYTGYIFIIIKTYSAYILGLGLNLAFFLWYNATFYWSIENQGYSNQLLDSWLGNFPESFFGVWLSPSKGILVYSPVLIFSLVGLWLVIKKSRSMKKDPQDLKYLIFGLTVLLHTLVISFWKHWYGGWSFGYRMSSDVLPFLILMLIPFIQSGLYKKYFKVFVVTIIFSVFVQLFGMVFFDGIWHAAYDRGFTNTSWLWSIKDSEFIFNIRRVLVKLGLLAKACPNCLPAV